MDTSIRELVEKYPYLKSSTIDYEVDPNDDFTVLDIIPVGWRGLFLQFCEDIRRPLTEYDALDTFKFTQVKEKFGELHIYCDCDIEEVNELILKYEHISTFVCEKCGRIADFTVNDGWAMNLCDHCSRDFTNKKPINVDPKIKISFFKPEKTSVVEIDCADIWEKYTKCFTNTIDCI